MQRRSIRLHESFVRDVQRHRAWLAAHGQAERIENLIVGVREVIERLRAFPASGPVIEQNDEVVMRELIFRRLRYVAHYSHRRREPIGDVWLIAHYGVGQDRSDPDPDAWVLD